MPDWSAMFGPQLSLLEVVARATIMYLFLFTVMRFLLKRQGSELNFADLLVVVAIIDGAQPAFTGAASSITESAVFVLTVLFWSWALNWLSFHIPALEFLTAARPIVLVENGRLHHANLRHALLTREELMRQLREQGIDSIDGVRKVMLEGDGEISVIEKR